MLPAALTERESVQAILRSGGIERGNPHHCLRGLLHAARNRTTRVDARRGRGFPAPLNADSGLRPVMSDTFYSCPKLPLDGIRNKRSILLLSCPFATASRSHADKHRGRPHGSKFSAVPRSGGSSCRCCARVAADRSRWGRTRRPSRSHAHRQEGWHHAALQRAGRENSILRS